MMRVNFRLMMVFVASAIVVTRFVAGCKPAEPVPTAAPSPAPTVTSEQQPGTSAPQAPAVPDAAEPAGSQVQFK